MLPSEESLSFQIAEYLQLQYPGVLYHIDFGSGAKLPMGLAVKQKRLNKRAWPDLLIARISRAKGHYGLFIELKREGTKLYLKDGITMVANEHYREQAKVLKELRDQGYKAEFGVGFEATKKLIDDYLRG